MVYIYFDGSKVAYMNGENPIFSFACDVGEFERMIAEFKEENNKIIYIDDEKELDRIKQKQLENIF